MQHHVRTPKTCAVYSIPGLVKEKMEEYSDWDQERELRRDKTHMLRKEGGGEERKKTEGRNVTGVVTFPQAVTAATVTPGRESGIITTSSLLSLQSPDGFSTDQTHPEIEG